MRSEVGIGNLPRSCALADPTKAALQIASPDAIARAMKTRMDVALMGDQFVAKQ
jgi:hypothetical protein